MIELIPKYKRGKRVTPRKGEENTGKKKGEKKDKNDVNKKITSTGKPEGNHTPRTTSPNPPSLSGDPRVDTHVDTPTKQKRLLTYAQRIKASRTIENLDGESFTLSRGDALAFNGKLYFIDDINENGITCTSSDSTYGVKLTKDLINGNVNVLPKNKGGFELRQIYEAEFVGDVNTLIAIANNPKRLVSSDVPKKFAQEHLRNDEVLVLNDGSIVTVVGTHASGINVRTKDGDTKDISIDDVHRILSGAGGDIVEYNDPLKGVRRGQIMGTSDNGKRRVQFFDEYYMSNEYHEIDGNELQKIDIFNPPTEDIDRSTPDTQPDVEHDVEPENQPDIEPNDLPADDTRDENSDDKLADDIGEEDFDREEDTTVEDDVEEDDVDRRNDLQQGRWKKLADTLTFWKRNRRRRNYDDDVDDEEETNQDRQSERRSDRRSNGDIPSDKRKFRQKHPILATAGYGVALAAANDLVQGAIGGDDDAMILRRLMRGVGKVAHGVVKGVDEGFGTSEPTDTTNQVVPDESILDDVPEEEQVEQPEETNPESTSENNSTTGGVISPSGNAATQISEEEVYSSTKLSELLSGKDIDDVQKYNLQNKQPAQ